MAEHTTLFDVEDLAPQADPKSLREAMFSALVATLEAEAARREPDFDLAQYQLDPQGRSHAGTVYWQEYQQACGIRIAREIVRSHLRTGEEILRDDRERTRRPWSDVELACIRHRDVCPRCIGIGQDQIRAEREADHLEQVRASYVEGFHDIIGALDDRERTVSLPQVRTALQQVNDRAVRLWQRGADHGH